eukprot:2073641-Pleurochrysis_carterae.AAC.3
MSFYFSSLCELWCPRHCQVFEEEYVALGFRRCCLRSRLSLNEIASVTFSTDDATAYQTLSNYYKFACYHVWRVLDAFLNIRN